MSRPDEKTKEEIRLAIKKNPTLDNKTIAHRFNAPGIAVANLRRGLDVRKKHSELNVNQKPKVRNDIKCGNHIEQIAERYDMTKEQVTTIQSQVIPKNLANSTSSVVAQLTEEDRMHVYEFDLEKLFQILVKTASAIQGDRPKFLHFRETDSQMGIREIEAQFLMSNILTQCDCYHIIENPTLFFKGRTDLSICTPNRIRMVDVEFKINEGGIKDDFIKFFSSPAFGSVSFFISVNSDLDNVSECYEKAYSEKSVQVKKSLKRGKWFLLFYLSTDENIAYCKFFDNILDIKPGNFKSLYNCKPVRLV